MQSNRSSSGGQQRDAKGRFTSNKKKPEKKKEPLERNAKGQFAPKKKQTVAVRSRSRSRSRDSRRRGRSSTRRSLARFPRPFYFSVPPPGAALPAVLPAEQPAAHRVVVHLPVDPSTKNGLALLIAPAAPEVLREVIIYVLCLLLPPNLGERVFACPERTLDF
ncbi:hypothetical protein CAEBREN_31003 [Caenorhabditis brenneri]|uniref:Uncharacterized protein n=1 Tax=Caenorhabditis brenneri TaxID=135651 RepID=G0P089_CAEBE|nr:hypothetical protein CAEBREN_31003 [Caenorhabditis brenneri]